MPLDSMRQLLDHAAGHGYGLPHGAYTSSRKPTGDIVAIDRIRAIHRRIPNTHLVMHGSSSVPQVPLDRMAAKYPSGELKQARELARKKPGREGRGDEG